MNAKPPGLAAYAGFLLGMYEVDRRGLMDVFHEGAIILVLMIVCIVSTLVVYGWLGCLVHKYLPNTGIPQVLPHTARAAAQIARHMHSLLQRWDCLVRLRAETLVGSKAPQSVHGKLTRT